MTLTISGTLTETSATEPSDRLPRIAYRNHFSDGDVTASSEQADHPAEAALDPFTATAWIGESGEGPWSIRVSKDGARADYAAVTGWRGEAGANPLSMSGVTVRVQYSDDGGESWEDVGDPVMPDGRVAGFLFDSQAHDDWRLLFEADEPPEIVNVSLGEATVMEAGVKRGFEPPVQARNNEIMNNRTEQGHLVGRSIIRKGIETSLELSNVSENWVRDTWEPLIDHMEKRGAYIIWSPAQWPKEIAYIWASGRFRAPRYASNAGWMSVQLEVQGMA